MCFLFTILLYFIAKETKELAEGELAKTGEALNSGIKSATETIDSTKKKAGEAVNTAGGVLDQTKKAANDALNQGVKAAEQAIDAQVQQVDKVTFLRYLIKENNKK